MGNLQVHTLELEALVDSIVVETLQVIREQVAVQQWKVQETIFSNQRQAE
ncbi:MAG: hypothetical protein NVS3B3_20550 [Aquirhabdus sp.]